MPFCPARPVVAPRHDDHAGPDPRGASPHRDRVLVLGAVAGAAPRHPGPHDHPPLPRRYPDRHARRPGHRMAGRRARRGAHQLGLGDGQADHADLCRAGHLVRRHLAARRPAPHPRCHDAGPHHLADRAQARLHGPAGAPPRALRSAAAPELRPPAAHVRLLRGPEHPAAVGPAGQAGDAPGAQSRHRPGSGDTHRTAARPGGSGPAGRGLAPARQPGAQGLRARGRVRVEPTRLVVLSREKLRAIAER